MAANGLAYPTCARLVPYRGFSGDDDFAAKAIQGARGTNHSSLCPARERRQAQPQPRGAFSLRIRLTIERADALRAPHRSIGMGQWQQTVVGQGWRLLLLLQPAGRAAG